MRQPTNSPLTVEINNRDNVTWVISKIGLVREECPCNSMRGHRGSHKDNFPLLLTGKSLYKADELLQGGRRSNGPLVNCSLITIHTIHQHDYYPSQGLNLGTSLSSSSPTCPRVTLLDINVLHTPICIRW